ncbi:GUN4 domain-containing protein [Cylindrospermopsis raciborskii]|uniref:GUN4 domain-containing protein n=2 Tax=Cylindrospermopsis raciborskii TaxID=77022 RepID=UPI0021553A7E|nr:GUN4 domain-containing protein [Cylindrospermopsis raciborskii]
MDTGTDKGIPDWLNPDRLIELIELLREAGYKIGISQHIAAQDIILFLITQGQTLDNPKQLINLLGPIFSKSLIEQENFQYHFDNWLKLIKQIGLDDDTSVLPLKISVPSHTTEKVSLPVARRRIPWRQLQWILIFIAVLMGTPTTTQKPPSTNPPSSPTTTPTPKQTLPSINPTPSTTGTPIPEQPSSVNWQITLIYFLLSLCFLYIGSQLLWLWRANLFLHRSSTKVIPDLQTISIPDLEQNLFPRYLFISIAKNFRQRILVPTNILDVEKTIDAFFQRGRWVEPIYRNSAVIPEYLFLVERTSYRDHQSKFVAEMIEQLKNDGVYVETYFYDEDPRICFSSDEHNSSLKLHQIATKYSQHYLIVVSDTEKLFSSITGELEPWVNQLLDWQNRVILTPTPVENYSYEKFVLAQDFLILPATSTGLQTLSQKLQQQIATNHYLITETPSPLPESLRLRPLYWIERNSPPTKDIDAMLVSLEEYLGKNNFYWLGACAVFPQLHWNITVYLGNTLKTEMGHSLLEVGSLTKLARLPWLRYGYMPDWLRSLLIAKLTNEQKHTIRTVLKDLLVTAVQGSKGGLQLEVAKKHHSFLSKLLANPIMFYLLSRRVFEGSELRDHLFVSFMTRQSKLTIEVSDTFIRLLQRTPQPLITRGILKKTGFALGLLTLTIIAQEVSVRVTYPPTVIRTESPLSISKLEALLKAKNFKEADLETDRVMLAVANRQSEGWLRIEDAENFPCKELRTIDNLWLKYSQGKFGISVQQEIYKNLGGTKQFDYDVWISFGRMVGWFNQRREDGWFNQTGSSWLDYSDINFSLSAPTGHLPTLGGGWENWFIIGVRGSRRGFVVLFPPVKTCRV